jgi:hypothetical protein
MFGFDVQIMLWKACTLNSCEAFLIHNANDRTGQQAAVVPPGRSTIPEGAKETKQFVCVTSRCNIQKKGGGGGNRGSHPQLHFAVSYCILCDMFRL